MSYTALAVISVVVPVLAVIIELMGSAGISDRHHSHHDSYGLPAAFSRALVVGMVFMGVTGALLGWLSRIGVFLADQSVMIAFFAAFLIVLFAIWLAMRRYRVATYSDRLTVTPFIGRAVTVRYADIERMEWMGVRLGTGYRNLGIYADGRRRAVLWGLLDIEQILVRIDRFDVLDRS